MKEPANPAVRARNATWSFEWRDRSAPSPDLSLYSPDHIASVYQTVPQLSLHPEAHAENLAEFIQKLNPDPFTLVHDYGGPIGRLCLEHPERETVGAAEYVDVEL
jgi:hypothetical protein